MIAISHPTGNQNLRHAMRAMQEASLLHSFHTTLGFSVDTHPEHWPLPARFPQLLSKRKYAVSKKQLHTSPCREIIRSLLIKHPDNPLVRHETGPCSVDGVYHALDRKLARYLKLHASELSAVYGYEDGCLAHFRQAKAAGLTTLYELPIAYGPYAQAVLQKEAERWPDWEPTLISTRDSAAKMQRKQQELELADVIITPSAFVEQSIPEELLHGRQVLRMPYGIEEPRAEHAPDTDSRRPIRVLYVGALSQRKGLADLFEAWKLADLHGAELHIIGSLLMPESFYRERCPGAILHGPQGRNRVLEMMDQCNALALPSLIEGRALVQLEALGRGLPLIITPNTGGDDLIEERQTGLTTPIRDPQALADKLKWFHENRDLLPAMKRACLEKARQTSWLNYRKQLADALKQLGNSK